MNKTIFLMTAAEESHLLDLSSRIDGALHAEQGETPQDFAKRLMDKEAVTDALQAAGIDTAKEADFLKKKAAIPSFTVTMLIDNTAPADSRERLFLYTSKAPTTPAEIPQEAAVIDKYKSIATLKRTAQGKAIAEIREALISCNGVSLPVDSSYLPFAAWDAFINAWAIIGNVGTIGQAKAKQIISIYGGRIKSFDYPLDKVNANIWKLLEKDMGGQVAIAVESSRDKGKKELNIYYSIDFGEFGRGVRITRRLEPFDKRVYIAIGALWAAGNQIVTIKQIYYAMGGTGNPAAYQIEKIETALKKMLAARVDIDNIQEANAYEYPHFPYHGNLLPMEFIPAIVNGKTIDGAVHLFREPPLITFARERKQITTIERQLLTTPLSKTNENLMLEDYLLERIAHAKKGHMPRKILFSTIYEEARITEKKQRQRAQEKIKRILGYYQKCGHIKGYKMEADSITLSL